MKKIILFALLFSFSATTYMSAQDKQTQKEILQPTYNNSKAKINTQHYQFVGDAVYDNDKREMLEKDSNKLVINKSEAFVNISSLSAVNRTVNVKSTVENYKVSFNDNQQEILIDFNVGKDRFHIKINASGHAFLTLTSGVNNISQVGKIQRI